MALLPCAGIKHDRADGDMVLIKGYSLMGGEYQAPINEEVSTCSLPWATSGCGDDGLPSRGCKRTKEIWLTGETAKVHGQQVLDIAGQLPQDPDIYS